MVHGDLPDNGLANGDAARRAVALLLRRLYGDLPPGVPRTPGEAALVREVVISEFLGESRDITTLAAALGQPYASVWRRVQGLASDGVLVTAQDGRRVVVACSPRTALEAQAWLDRLIGEVAGLASAIRNGRPDAA